jgi:glycosyltransferase involved in cell wall biosynthesis
MPRVLELCEPADGGAAENAAQLAIGAGAHGWEAEYGAPAGGAKPEPALAAAGIPVHRLPLAGGFGSPPATARAIRAVTAIVRERDIDVLHCHSAPTGVIGRLAARRAGVRCVYSPHAFPFVAELGRARNLLALVIERRLAPLADVILCVCEAERRIALERRIAPEQRLRVVLNGAPACDDSVAIDPQLAALAAGGPLVASVAALRRQKRIDVWLDAAADVLSRVPDARAAVVGDGPEAGALREHAARLGLDREPRFAFVAFSDPAARYLRALDVLVLPSSWEAFPIGILEALACGVPQVATDVGGTAEAVVPETGVLVPPADPRAIADAVHALLADPIRREAMAAASRERHAARFTLERMVAGTVSVYREVLSASGITEG